MGRGRITGAMGEQANGIRSNGYVPIADSFGHHLREIGQIPLLTAEEEKDLAYQIRDGVMAEEELESLNALHSEPESERAARLAEIIEAGHQAKRHFVEANLRLVVSVAKTRLHLGLELEDLVQEGYISLMHAVDKFDPDLNYKFSTYAIWWIQQGIDRALADKSKTIRLPVHLVDKIRRVNAATAKLLVEKSRPPTDEEVAEATCLTLETVQKCREAWFNYGEVASLDFTIGDDRDGDRLGDFIKDISQDTEGDGIKDSISAVLMEALQEFNERERLVIIGRFNLDGNGERTLDEIGGELGLTRERVRQIEGKVLCKLRHPTRGPKLSSLLD